MPGQDPDHDVPFARLETVFLDVGNTLVSMDHEWIAEELAKRGVEVELGRLMREEARARPVVSRSLTTQEEHVDGNHEHVRGLPARDPRESRGRTRRAS